MEKMRLIVHAVMEDIRPRAIVESGGDFYCVSLPQPQVSADTRMSRPHAMAAMSKHAYQALEQPLELDDLASLKTYLSSKAVDPAALLAELT